MQETHGNLRARDSPVSEEQPQNTGLHGVKERLWREKVEKARGGSTARERDWKGQELLLHVCGDGVAVGAADPSEPEGNSSWCLVNRKNQLDRVFRAWPFLPICPFGIRTSELWETWRHSAKWVTLGLRGRVGQLDPCETSLALGVVPWRR